MGNSIEEDIELLQDETSSLGLFFKCKGSEKYKIALEHILSDYKRVLKENEELKADNYELNNRITDLLENIPIRKVKDRIEKYKELSDKFYVKFLESDRYNTDIREKGIKCDAIILALEELIEEREEN